MCLLYHFGYLELDYLVKFFVPFDLRTRFLLQRKRLKSRSYANDGVYDLYSFIATFLE